MYTAEQDRRRVAQERKGELSRQFVILLFFCSLASPQSLPSVSRGGSLCRRCDQKVLVYTSSIVATYVLEIGTHECNTEAYEYDQSALEYFRSRNMDTNEDQSRVPKIILAQRQAEQEAHEQGYVIPEEQEDLDSLLPRQYRPELSTITERSEIISEFSLARASRNLELPPTRRGGADSSRTTSYGEPLGK